MSEFDTNFTSSMSVALEDDLDCYANMMASARRYLMLILSEINYHSDSLITSIRILRKRAINATALTEYIKIFYEAWDKLYSTDLQLPPKCFIDTFATCIFNEALL